MGEFFFICSMGGRGHEESLSGGAHCEAQIAELHATIKVDTREPGQLHILGLDASHLAY